MVEGGGGFVGPWNTPVGLAFEAVIEGGSDGGIATHETPVVIGEAQERP